MRLRDWAKLLPVFGKSLCCLPWGHIWYLTKRLRLERLQSHGGRVYVNTFLPPMPSPAFGRMIETLSQGRRVPFSTYFAVTDRCPYRCGHCSYGKRPVGQMDTERALDVIAQIKGLGATTLGFSGGEPLLREDLPELVQAVGEDTESILFTTGFGLEQERAQSLRAAGLNCLMVGLEAEDAETHDAIRQAPGSFQTGLKAIDRSLHTGFYTAISTMATKEKLRDGQIAGMAELARRWGVQEFRILEPVPTGRALGQEQTLLDETDRQQLTDFHRQWNRRGKAPTIASFSYLESAEMFGCGAGYHHLYIDARGHVCPCDLTPLSFGNVLQEPLAAIWQRMGEYFSQPRCHCFAQTICMDASLAESESLPLEPEVSDALCRETPRTDLPRVYQNLSIVANSSRP